MWTQLAGGDHLLQSLLVLRHPFVHKLVQILRIFGSPYTPQCAGVTPIGHDTFNLGGRNKFMHEVVA
jgi:hypothetical protein